ncbi:hypothetical protein EOA79_02390 [Mesorhizobium sp. M1A.F.Ca.IN.020.03.2.1]|uniref:hypothetical protein n=1 Tax=Mesorhizobium sp. M1A.F.Ca.IN.020.03.2.1 TaxID=2496769 RepID=UPI000FD341A0|nr:hypothetical protein [Mesorhizobium sp. M1A.F.Ca.IN.020.03.2.1]RUV07958.1 hypothetical protein EOA79_02390 [Mesorhizobium sp. M1A.F.Ca.IN.020.03.2.1]
MNSAEVKAVPVSNGYEGHFKKIHRSEWEPVCENGIAQLFDTEEQAEVAAYRALMKHIFGDIVRDGEKASTALSEAEEKFGKLLRGGGKTVKVVRR